jgi:fatty-acyl-CoA synthase
MLPNTPPMVEAHFGIPMSGAVLNTLNTRLDAEALAFMLDHGEAKAVIVDPEFAAVMSRALAMRQSTHPVLVIDTEDALYAGTVQRIGSQTYDDFVATGDAQFAWHIARRRVGRHQPELHLRHHRQPQGRGLPPPWRGAQRHLQHPGVGHAQARRLPVDAADVPLQRLVLPVDGGGPCRRQRLPAQGGPQGHLRRHPQHKVTHYCGAPIVHAP